MRKLLKYLSVIVFVYIAVNLLCGHSSYLLDRSINNQINYIDLQLKNGADAALQKKYPEGALFSNCIFALSVIEFSKSISFDQKRNSEIIDRCLNVMLSEDVKVNFSEDLTLRYGAFYTGWTNYTLKRYIESGLFEYSEYKKKFSDGHEALNKSLLNFQSDTIHLAETYHNGYWPADNLVCISSLPKEYSTLKKEWLKALVDQSTNDLDLIHHDGYNTTVARGSSQALILYFLSDLDREFSLQSNATFNTNYIDGVLGVRLVKEYIAEGEMDIDSGPIVLGFGSVATIMNVKAQSALGNKERMTWGALNLAGIPMNIWGNKYYLFEQELMFDIFMLWSSVSLR